MDFQEYNGTTSSSPLSPTNGGPPSHGRLASARLELDSGRTDQSPDSARLTAHRESPEGCSAHRYVAARCMLHAEQSCHAGEQLPRPAEQPRFCAAAATQRVSTVAIASTTTAATTKIRYCQ